MYGIDKSEIRNIIIESIDFQVLRNSQKAIYNISQSELAQVVRVHNTNQYIKLDRLYIPDDELFNSFTMDYKNDMGARTYYSSLDLALKPKKGRKHNLTPMSTKQYLNKLEEIKEYLRAKYGVYISYNDSRIHYIELNITDTMEYSFNDYYYLFEAIKDNRNRKKYSKYSLIGSDRIETFEMFPKKGAQVLKFYDKTKQLYDCFKIQINNEYMRLEYSLTGYEKIKQSLGTDRLQDLTDDKIISFLNDSIKSDVFEPINKHIAITNKALLKKYKELKKQYKRGYIREFAHYCNSKESDMFDVKQCLDIVKKDMTKSKSKNHSYNKKLIDSIISPELKNNLKKFEEFKVKFHIINF